MPHFKRVIKLILPAFLLAACGAPDFEGGANGSLPEKWTPEAVWKSLGPRTNSGLANFHFDASQKFFLSTGETSFQYRAEDAPLELALLGERGFTGNGGDFRWSTDLIRDGAWNVQRHELLFKNVPVDSVEVKKVYTQDGSVWMNGVAPRFALSHNGDVSAPDFILSKQETKSKAPSFLHDKGVIWSEGEATYFAGAESLIPAWKFVVAPSNGVQYPSVPTEILISAVTGEMLKSRPLAAHATGTATMFDENAIADAGNSETVQLPYIKDGQNFLKSDYWEVKNCDREEASNSNCQATLGKNGSNQFSAFPYNGGTLVTGTTDFQQYDELVAYHAVAKAWDWNKDVMNLQGVSASQYTSRWGSLRSSMGLSTSNPLTVYTRAKVKSSTGEDTYNNAQYLPGGLSGTGGPAILIGTGDETSICSSSSQLCNLGKDADVTMHEFHHHIVFRSITSTSGESGAMHEGISDFLTYAITGNNKLAETIVPASNSKGALRAGNITGSIATYRNQGVHKAGEFWSSTLWEVRTTLGTNSSGRYKADKIVWDAIDLSVGSETYYGFISAMAKAAEAYASANGDDATALRKAIFKVFANRGFLASESLDGSLPAPGAGIAASSGASETTTVTTTRTSRSGGVCGVVAGRTQTSTPWGAVLLFFAVGVVPFAFTRRKAPTPARLPRP
jgi:hypothetical protein